MIQLDWERFESRIAIATRIMQDNIAIKSSMDHLIDSMVVSITADILTDKDQPREYVHHYNVPATWWDHLKATYRMPFWLKPPRLKSHRVVVEIQQFTAYPHARYARELGRGYRHFTVKYRGE